MVFSASDSAVSGPGGYALCPASATTHLGQHEGAVGNYLDYLLVVVSDPATAAVTIQDGADMDPWPVFPNNPGGGVGSYPVPIGATSRNGPWIVTTGAGAVVLASGAFS